MDIREAITKAGPTGKGYNTERGMEFTIDGNGFIVWPHRSPNIADFDSQDWEVVTEERIEVGDKVELKGGIQEDDMHPTVMAVDNKRSGRHVCIQYDDESIGIEPTNALTLIHKGSKPAEYAVKVSRYISDGMVIQCINGEAIPTDAGALYAMTLKKVCE